VLSFSIYSTATYTLYYYWWLQTFFHENGKNKYWKKDYDSNSFIKKNIQKELNKTKKLNKNFSNAFTYLITLNNQMEQV